jgi:hypothetical protein
MPLLTFWTSDPHAVEELSAEQVVASAGDGALKDDSNCSQELREYLSQIPSNKIAMYIDRCLCSGFNQSAMVLQDLVNELGRRLGYDVTNGRYQETHNAIGCDGIWMSPEAHTIVAEVKTTDAYRISLDTIASYRDKLLASNKIAGSSSILIVVGREDTGELEAQVRGSRHAWDIRMISADSMIKLVQLKENADDPDAGTIIRSLLTPMEYTRLDHVVDVMFTTAKDVATATVSEVEEQDADQDVVAPLEKSKGAWEFTDSGLMQAKREEIVARFGRDRGAAFVKHSRALYWDSAQRQTSSMHDVQALHQGCFLSLLVRLPSSVGRFSIPRVRVVPHFRVYEPPLRVCASLEGFSRPRGRVEYNNDQGRSYVLAHKPGEHSV